MTYSIRIDNDEVADIYIQEGCMGNKLDVNTQFAIRLAISNQENVALERVTIVRE